MRRQVFILTVVFFEVFLIKVNNFGEKKKQKKLGSLKMIIGKSPLFKVGRYNLQNKELCLKYEGDQMITLMIFCEEIHL